MSITDPLTQLINTLHALTVVMEQESETLSIYGPQPEIRELAKAKVRLVAQLDNLSAQLGRENAEWIETLNDDDRTRFSDAAEALMKAAADNSSVLEQQIDLSNEMLQAVGVELERLTGRRGSTYSRLGDIRRMQGRAPLSINQRY